MDRQIRKYLLDRHGVTNISMPEGSSCFKVDKQGGELTMWALCPIDMPEVVYRFQSAVTGQIMQSPTLTPHYLGTVLFNKGSYVVHVFSNCKSLQNRY